MIFLGSTTAEQDVENLQNLLDYALLEIGRLQHPPVATDPADSVREHRDYQAIGWDKVNKIREVIAFALTPGRVRPVRIPDVIRVEFDEWVAAEKERKGEVAAADSVSHE